MSLDSDVYEGSKAEKLLNDEMLMKAFSDVEQAIVDKWKSSPIRDKEGAAELRLMVKLLNDVKANLELAVHNGKLAAEELRQQKDKPKWWAINRG